MPGNSRQTWTTPVSGKDSLSKRSGSSRRRKRSAKKILDVIEPGLVQQRITSFLEKFGGGNTGQGPCSKLQFGMKRKSEQIEGPTDYNRRIKLKEDLGTN